MERPGPQRSGGHSPRDTCLGRSARAAAAPCRPHRADRALLGVAREPDRLRRGIRCVGRNPAGDSAHRRPPDRRGSRSEVHHRTRDPPTQAAPTCSEDSVAHGVPRAVGADAGIPGAELADRRGRLRWRSSVRSRTTRVCRLPSPSLAQDTASSSAASTGMARGMLPHPWRGNRRRPRNSGQHLGISPRRWPSRRPGAPGPRPHSDR